MSDILEKVRKLNRILQQERSEKFDLTEMCNVLSELLNANIYIADAQGTVISASMKIKQDSPVIKDMETGDEAFPGEYNEGFMSVMETAANLSGEDALKIFKYDYDTSEKLHTIIPVYGVGKRWGTLIMTRYEPEFSDEDLVLGEYGATVVGLEMMRKKWLETKEEERLASMVQMAIGTLSYSEIEAVQCIFAELPGEEGLLVASKIADKSGITRSVIVNALRKLESAGVIESRSLGMKGTRIKILNPNLKSELAKLNG